jgi:two-component system sensor histidine kinase VanS
MKGMIEGMIDGVGRYKDKEKYLNELLLQIETIESITKDLTYSLRLEDKKKTEDFTSTDTLLKQLKSLETFASQHQIVIQKTVLKSDLYMSEELLGILITNLVKNAILYSDDKFVYVDGAIENNYYTLTVKNKGFIPEDQIDKLFNSFYRIQKQKEKTTGSGLGLFIVKQICDLYGYSYKLFNDNGYVTTKIQIKIKNELS